MADRIKGKNKKNQVATHHLAISNTKCYINSIFLHTHFEQAVITSREEYSSHTIRAIPILSIVK